LAIARIANIIEEAYLDEIKGKLTTKPKPGSINYIEDLLKSRNLNYDNNALKILRKLYKLRSTKAPIHSGEHEAVDILNEFGIDYPVSNYIMATGILIDNFLLAIRSISLIVGELQK
jgi:hypothetical protein